MGDQVPIAWKGLTIDEYNGTTDLNEYVNVYTTQMSLYTSDNVVLCQVFPTSLNGGALSWFTRLPPNSIDCFETQSQIQANTGGEKRKDKEKEKNSRQPFDRNDKYKKNCGPRFTIYTPLNADRGK